MTKKESIQEFRKEKFGIGQAGSTNQGLRKDLQNALEVISKDIYSDDSHFIYELIQNAQDNKYDSNITPTLKFIFLDDDPTRTEGAKGCLCIINNEQGFRFEDVKDICSIGESAKRMRKEEGLIGEKGLGFKSVFKITSSPHIYSNGFQFYFKEDDPDVGLGYIVPYWCDEVPNVIEKYLQKNTCILLPIKNGKQDDIREMLMEHKGEVMLFLGKLQKLEIEIPNQNYSASFTKREDSGNVIVISNTINGEAENQRFIIESKLAEVPKNMSEKKREGVESRTISIAYPSATYDSISVFGYLPTKMVSGLPFIINADFLLTTNREAINDSEWNQWLINELSGLAVTSLVEQITTGNIGIKGYSFIPKRQVAKDKSKDKPFSVIASIMLEELKSKEIIFGDDGKWHIPSSCRLITEEFRNLFSRAPRPASGVWVNKAIQTYSARLQTLGVKNIPKKESMEMMMQSEWIINQSSKWFTQYYQYLLESNFAVRNPEDFKDLPLIPAESGKISSINGGFVFLPSEDSHQKTPTGKLFPAPDIFRQSLLKITRKNDSLHDFIHNHIGLSIFSHEHYFYNAIPEHLDNQVSLTEKKKLIRYVINHWDELKDRYWGEFPLVLLEDGTIMILGHTTYIEEYQLVRPRSSKGEIGWDKVFTKEETDEWLVLHPFYRELNQTQVEAYYEELNVDDWPAPNKITIRSSTQLDDDYDGYADYINSEFFSNTAEHYTSNPKSATVPMLPDSFSRVSKLTKIQRNSLIRYLEWLVLKPELERAKGHYFHYHAHSVDLDSPIGWSLKKSSWIMTTKGLKPAPECFANNPDLKGILGSDIPYVQDELSKSMIDYLDIKTSRDTKSLLAFLRAFSKKNNTLGTRALIRIYSSLHEMEADISEDFSKFPLIYVPDIGWKTSSEVIWENELSIDEDGFVELKEHYSGLKDFFIKKLQVLEHLNIEAYAKLWLDIQEKNDTLDEMDRVRCARCFSKIRSEAKKEKYPAWLVKFRKNAKLYTDRGWLNAYDEPYPYLPDDKRLRKAFLGKVPFVTLLEKSWTYNRMSELTDFLGVRKLSSSVNLSLSHASKPKQTSENEYLTDFSRKFICLVIANRDKDGREVIEEAMASGKIKSFFSIQEKVVDNLAVEAKIEHTDIYVEMPNEAVYLDETECIAYINELSSDAEIRDAFERLSLKFLLADFNASIYEDSLRWYLKISDEQEYKGHTERMSDWRLPPKVRKHIEKIVKDRRPTPDISTDELRPEGMGIKRGHRPSDGYVKKKSVGTRRSQSNRYDGESVSSTPDAPRKEKQARQSRIVSYVSSQSNSEPNSHDEEQSHTEEAKQLGEKSESIVLKDLKGKGYDAKRMRRNYPGYDIEAINTETGEVFYVEVKSDSYTWSKKGVGLTSTQFEFAKKQGKQFILAIVENIKTNPSKPIYIQDPVAYITNYQFDSGWQGLATEEW
ncbi:MAG: sacsin N-terminal ATP-binding-like domain-containing protein [Pseudohongiellaceae bacterium]